jgi:acyl dehydratase
MGKTYLEQLAAVQRAARGEYEHVIAPFLASSLASGRRAIAQAPIVRKKKSGLGGFIAAGFGVALIAGAAYLAWQVLRTDDESWVDDDFDVD